MKYWVNQYLDINDERILDVTDWVLKRNATIIVLKED